MKLTLNGETVEMSGRVTVAALVAGRANGDGRGVAVAVNGEVVRRAEWETTELRADDRVEVLHAIGGGC